MVTPRTCETPGCNGKHKAHGLCRRCYQRQWWRGRRSSTARRLVPRIPLATRQQQVRNLIATKHLGTVIALAAWMELGTQRVSQILATMPDVVVDQHSVRLASGVAA